MIKSIMKHSLEILVCIAIACYMCLSIQSSIRIRSLHQQLEEIKYECYDAVENADRANIALEIINNELDYLRNRIDPYWEG